MSDYPELEAQLRLEEGVKPCVYQDSKGIYTLGVGFNVDAAHDGGLDDVEIDFILEHRIAKAAIGAEMYPWFPSLSHNRQMVILDMIYNMGANKFTLFHGIHHAIAIGDYDCAANNMLNSLWAREVGSRAARLARIMRGDVWE